MPKSIKAMRQDFKKYGIFYTPPELAQALLKYISFMPRDVYDPTCGQGNLLAAFPDDVPKYGQELHPADLEAAKLRLTNFTGYAGDTLADDGFPGKRFHVIVANPPFSVRWDPVEQDPRWSNAPCIPSAGKADYAFLLHILAHLADDGIAVCLEFPGILYRGQREGKIREWMVRQNYIERVVSIPGNTFEDTQIGTCILVLSKSKATADIIFEDRENGIERTVPFSEIEENGFTLSVQTYVKPPIEEEEIEGPSIDEINKAVRELAIQGLRGSIEVEKVRCKLEGEDLQPFLVKLKNVIAEYEAEVER